MHTKNTIPVHLGEVRMAYELFPGETLRKIGLDASGVGKESVADPAREEEVSGTLQQTGEELRDMRNAVKGNLMTWKAEDVQRLRDTVHGKLSGMREITGEAWQIFLRALSGDTAAICSVVDRNLTHDFRIILDHVSPDKFAIVLDALCAMDPHAAECMRSAELAGRALGGDGEAQHELASAQSQKQNVIVRTASAAAKWLSGDARGVDEKATIQAHFDASLAALGKQFAFMSPGLIRSYIDARIQKHS